MQTGDELDVPVQPLEKQTGQEGKFAHGSDRAFASQSRLAPLLFTYLSLSSRSPLFSMRFLGVTSPIFVSFC